MNKKRVAAIGFTDKGRALWIRTYNIESMIKTFVEKSKFYCISEPLVYIYKQISANVIKIHSIKMINNLI